MNAETANQLATLGVPGLVVCVVALTTALIFIYRNFQKLQDKFDAVQEQRIVDAGKVLDKITEPVTESTNMVRQVRDILLNTREK